MKGCFIVFEGTEGAGKTKQVELLEETLQKKNYDVVVTREPTSSAIGNLIHQILYGKIKASDESLALLFAADRADHTKRIIAPALTSGSVVLCDRYIYSSLSYQSKGMRKPLSLDWLKNINKFTLKPDLVFFLDVPPEIGLGRLRKGQKRIQDDKYFEDFKKQQLIREKYHEVLNLKRTVSDLRVFQMSEKKRRYLQKSEVIKVNNTLVVKIDGTHSIKEIHKKICDHALSYLKNRNIPKKENGTPHPEKIIRFTGNK